jgi:hypothetical protein
VRDRSFIYTITSYSVIVAIFVNLNNLRSPFVGFMAFAIYFLINAVFLGNAFFEKEKAFFRLLFGVLVLIMLLGSVGWVIMIIYNLDIAMFTLVLIIATTISSFFNRRVKHENAA